MSRYRELSEHLKRLADIRAILAGMRTLAAVELQRVTRLQDAGEALRQGLEAAVAAHFAGRPPPVPQAGVCVLLGSEKGLCGDFNERLLAEAAHHAGPRVLVGSKLAVAAAQLPVVVARCPGALAADDVGPVLTGLAQTLAGLDAAGGRLDVLCHDPQQHRVRWVKVLPPPVAATRTEAAPRLQLPAPQFEAALLEQYLFAVFNGLLIGSLLVENQQRIAHLQAALQRLDERCDRLRQRQRHARQEQIIEEVEVALSVAGTGK
ncbi:MAG: hypothetical protein Kow0073_10970 [Immundisolibacter sp.]